ncbi:MAG: PucR family transcriptional regulator [Clostridiales bacterium]|jgi:carbohydrate diacid regulator|nr:PucR family transcriptional regulator [Clostridiales bacterium]
MSGRMLQGLVLQMKDVSERVIGVIDSTGTVVACSDLSEIGAKRDVALASLYDSTDVCATADGYTYKPLSNWSVRFDYAVFISGEDELARSLCLMASVALNNAKNFYDEKHDKATFIKNIILDNILSGDIYIKSNELSFPMDIPHVVFLIRLVDKTDIAAVDVLQSLFPDKQRDFVISISEQDIVLVKEVRLNVDTKEFLKLAKTIEDTLNSELYLRCVIGIGTIAPNLKELAVSYKEAQVAIEVGKVFDTEKNIISYENLGIGRLIYQLPTTLCEMFLSEVFKKNSIDALDQETLHTIQKFFENNLNVSETSRKLFVHRNTLVYRLEKIKKITGLDLREFDHAIIFKVALMVKRYLSSHEAAF